MVIETGQAWSPNVISRSIVFERIEFSYQSHRVLQHTELTNNQRNILKKLKIKPPKRIVSIDPIR